MSEKKERIYKVTEKITWKVKAKSKDKAIDLCQNSEGDYENTVWS